MYGCILFVHSQIFSSHICSLVVAIVEFYNVIFMYTVTIKFFEPHQDNNI